MIDPIELAEFALLKIIYSDSSEILAYFQEKDQQPMDLAHVFKIAGEVYARKPKKILEIGIGTGLLSAHLLKAISHNGLGKLTCVDMLSDFCGQKKAHVELLEKYGAELQVKAEADYLRDCKEQFDIVIADAEHKHDGEDPKEIVKPYVKVCKPEGIVFIHDTNNGQFPNLSNARQHVECDPSAYGVSWHEHFVAKSRPRELCDRGLFMMKKKPAG
jgi:predicted O-methyltransferase YrrM